MASNRHDNPPRTAGAPLDSADAAVVLLHGRGATADGILQLSTEFSHDGVAYVAPQADRNTWYPQSFLAPIEDNEPWLSAALEAVAGIVDHATAAGIPLDRVLLVGFSQGACLGSEFVARNAARYGGVAALSGGVIGPDGTPRDYRGSLEGTPVFLGCSDVDPHIPLERVHETAEIFDRMDGDVTTRIYEGMGHGINEDEVTFVDGMVGAIAGD